MTLVLAGLLAVLIGLLAVPVEIAFVLRREARFEAGATLVWLFGRVRVPLRAAAWARERAPTAKPGSGLSRLGSLVQGDGALERGVALLRRLLNRVRLRRLRLHARLGLDDPADTGRLWGLAGALAATLPAPDAADISIQPDFTGAVLWLDGEGRISLVPLAVIGTLLVFALSPRTWRALRSARSGR